MKKNRKNGGFTLAELLIVIAIIGVLAGVSFIAVQSHQNSMAQLKRDAIAKEIFVAAQNHLSLAKTQDFNGNVNFGAPGKLDEDKRGSEQIVYYFTNDDLGTAGGNILDQMLPFGSIDETVRAGGGYLIRYQPSAGRVLDVFYWEKGEQFLENSKTFNNGSATSYDDLMRTDNPLKGVDDGAKRNRSNNKPMIGWYGGEGVVEPGVFLETPSIKLVNAEKLRVEIKDMTPDSSAEKPKLKMIITGQTSGAMAYIALNGNDNPRISINDDTYTVVLDDITTQNMHFADLKDGEAGVVFKQEPGEGSRKKTFIPGEDITVQAVAYSDAISSIAYTGEWTTNSLFESIRTETIDSKEVSTALIGNIRHLENLNASVSSVGTAFAAKTISLYSSAEQTADLDWPSFTNDIAGKAAVTGEDGSDVSGDGVDTSVHIYTLKGDYTKGGCFLPVDLGSGISYNGRHTIESTVKVDGVEQTTSESVTHYIKGIVVDDTGENVGTVKIEKGGLFGATNNNTISNLELIDFSVSLKTGDVGALAGSLTTSNVTNVIAHNSTNETTTNISTKSGNAGGLVGSMKDSTVTKSAAALIVSSEAGDAGGLVGSASGGSVSGSYAGGHTLDNADTGAVEYSDKSFNVTGTGNVGGLVGKADNTPIQSSYSTCSATGKTVGGLVGSFTGSSATVKASYATGLVQGVGDDALEGAFAGKLTGTATGCHYFEIVNERTDSDTGVISYLPAMADIDTTAGVTALDADAQSYNTFVGTPDDWKSANVYSAALLTRYYGVEDESGNPVSRYPMPTVAQLGAKITENSDEEENNTLTDFVATHYGDWPAPEIFVVNTKSGS